MKKILIIEDDGALRDGLGDKLTNKGFEILKSEDGQKGLRAALAEHPDLILLDILMPNMNGISMLQELRKDPWGKNAKVVLWSNSKNKDEAAAGVALNALAFWVKSDFNFTEIAAKITQILG